MGSRLLKTSIPRSVTSTVAFGITVDYESTSGGTLDLSVDDGFSVLPMTWPMKPSSSGSEPVQITITRGTATTHGCTLTLKFGSRLDPRIDEVK